MLRAAFVICVGAKSGCALCELTKNWVSFGLRKVHVVP